MYEKLLEDIQLFVETNINTFHENRLKRLQELKLEDILKRKNPYLFRVKNISTGEELVKSILDAYLSSQEETLFGKFLEELAIYIAEKVYGGHKSTAEGIDLEMEIDDRYYIVSIKSGPHWGNSSQIKRMKRNFREAIRRLRQNGRFRNIIAVNGCCYGRDRRPDKGDYLKLCGREFWKFISGYDNLYIDIIKPLGYKAREKNIKYMDEYERVINKFTFELMSKFLIEGRIDWEKLIKFSSS